jgi:hypothetical protein
VTEEAWRYGVLASALVAISVCVVIGEIVGGTAGFVVVFVGWLCISASVVLATI